MAAPATKPAVEDTSNVEGRMDPETGKGSDAIDINENLSATIKNPLAHLHPSQVMTNVERFAEEHGLVEELPLLRKGALVARDPGSYENLPLGERLNEDEIEALRSEVLHKWRAPRLLYLTIITCSIGAAVQGWDQEGSNGANLSFPAEFGIGGTDDRSVWLLGLINAAPYLGAAAIGCWCSDPLNSRFGRRGAIFISANFCFWPVIGAACTQNWWEILLCRLLLGIGMGIKGSTVPVYAAENSSAMIRGALVMTWQLWTAFGILLGVSANLILGKVGKLAWRLQLGSAMLPAIPLMALIFFCPESPRWLMKKRRYQEAYQSLLGLRNHPLQAARDIYFIHCQLEIERAVAGGATYMQRLVELFTIPRVRHATLASFVVMIAQQMCGINIIAFYSSTVFVKSGTSEYDALLASFGFGLVNFIFAWPAIWTIDTFGRRSLLLLTFPNMAWTLLAAGLCTLIPGTGGAHLGLVALWVYVFTAWYSCGEGPIPFVVSSEVFPLSHREVGMAWGVATCVGWAAVLTCTLPKMLEAFDVIGVFCFYAGLNVLAFVMIFLWVPETKQLTLEELDYTFAVPTRVFMRYQLTKALPYFFRRWVRWDRAAQLAPLYRREAAAAAGVEFSSEHDERESSDRQPQAKGVEEVEGTKSMKATS